MLLFGNDWNIFPTTISHIPPSAFSWLHFRFLSTVAVLDPWVVYIGLVPKTVFSDSEDSSGMLRFCPLGENQTLILNCLGYGVLRPKHGMMTQWPHWVEKRKQLQGNDPNQLPRIQTSHVVFLANHWDVALMWFKTWNDKRLQKPGDLYCRIQFLEHEPPPNFRFQWTGVKTNWNMRIFLLVVLSTFCSP